MTAESTIGADLYDRALRNTGLPRGVRCSFLEDAKTASRDTSLVRKAHALQMQHILMISDPAQMGARRARLSSVCEQQGDRALIHLSLLGIGTFDAENSLVCESHVLPASLLVCKQELKRPSGPVLSPA